jgi:acyl dehydratase
MGVLEMTTGKFGAPPPARYLEDDGEGAQHEVGPISISEDEIVRFGKTVDPQIFHSDLKGARF